MKAADLFVRALEQEGVDTIFGLPGEENLALLDAIRRSSIRFILTRHEQAAGFMAATYGRLTGRAGVCLATLGPGATNLVTAAAHATLGAMPMVMITGQKPIKSSKQGRFQILDVVDMMKPLTKFSTQITSGFNVPARIREAFRLAEEERPGAVHLELPEDIAAEEVTDAFLLPRERVRRPIAEEKAISRALAMIDESERPIILIGSGANRKLASKMLTRFVEKSGFYFITTQMGKGVVDERHPRYLGNAALSANDYIHCAIERADLIINVGHDVVEKPPFTMGASGPRVIHINFFSASVDAVYYPHHEVVGDIANAVWRITERLDPTRKRDLSYFARVKKASDENISAGCDDPRFPILPQRVVADIRKTLPSDGILTLDNGIYKIWFARCYPAHQPNTVLLDNALATMGAGLAAAMSARVVFPYRKIVAVCGDGGFLMNSQELETAVRCRLDLVIVLLNDGGYGMIRWKQEGSGLERYGLDFGNPDFVKYAEAYGAKGHRVENTADFSPLLERCLASGGVHLIDLPVDYSENVRSLTTALEEKTCAL
ncbi:MAG: acetolactate synthase large subunit [Candidatus Hydrogenedentota bacterium]|nr:MAG: acetolactate synthase large subunit [Candidatus Hydrogenedentota bacterium]